MRLRPLWPAFKQCRIRNGIDDVLAYLVATHPDVRTDRRDEILRIEGKFLAKSCNSRLDNTRCGSAPAGVNGCHCRAARVRDKDRHAVRSLNSKHDALKGRDTRVAFHGVTRR